jgi:hypothetical protein
MLQINDIINYNGIQLTCWLIDIIDDEIFIHLINDDESYGICILESELKNNII